METHVSMKPHGGTGIGGNKLRIYYCFKDAFEIEPYETSHLPRYHRSVRAKFRCGVVLLQVETRRFNNTLLEESTLFELSQPR